MSARLKLPLPPTGTEDAAAAFDGGLAAALTQVHAHGDGPAEDVPALMRAVREVAAAIREGQVCALIEDADTRAALARSPAVCDGSANTAPLVLQGERLYLQRYWRYQRGLAAGLRALNQAVPPADAESARAQLESLFGAADRKAPDWQRLAAATAISRRLCVLSGGPGTGKTTTVVRLLAALLMQDPTLRIALAAPTGKAAARIKESLRLQLERLPVDAALRERLPNQAQTVHRLLGYRPGRVRFRHDADNPLPYDVVVVDEASMLDLALAAKLVQAVPPRARLILLGDKDQLASVEAGSVFADLSRQRCYSAGGLARLAQLGDVETGVLPAPQPGGALEDAVIWLERSYRFDRDSGLGQLARAINAGDEAAVIAALETGAADWQSLLPPADALAARLLPGYEAFVETVRHGAPPATVLATFENYRALCGTRAGAQGTDALNSALARAFRRRLGEGAAVPAWYPGRPVMLTRNDYALRLFNGDIGVTLPGEDGRLRVYFPAAEGTLQAVLPARLTAVETAFALTVHKSQGSEFERVDVVLDPAATRGLTRELLYTAVTRARVAVRLWARPETLAVALGRATERRATLFSEPAGRGTTFSSIS